MGVFRKEKYRVSKRKFGQACGRSSARVKSIEKAQFLKREEKIKFYKTDPKQYQPYQLIRKHCSFQGTNITKFVVRRIPILRDRKSKLLSLGLSSLRFKYEENIKNVSGYRIMNLDILKEHIVKVTTHSCMCDKAQQLICDGKEPITLKTEINQKGLYSVLIVLCRGCNQQFPLPNSHKQPNGLYDINVRAVWGSVASGGGSSDLNEVLGTMNVPLMNEKMYTDVEEQIGNWWYNALKDEMLKAGAEERRIAIEKGVYHQGVPAITVVCDGGWSKRTHKHTYNASGGVAVIFGAETKKLLYIGVRNRYCTICRRAQNNETEPREHNCFVNWTESSQAMEADIILSGFLEAESTHGIRYIKVIADGDSSVFATLQENVPVWGKDITKMECANHICKCIRSNLEKLVQEKPQYKGKGKLTKINRVKLTTAVRCAIKMRTETKDSKQLSKDILNSVYHVFGFHQNCSDFCKRKPSKEMQNEKEEENDEEFDGDSFDNIFENQSEYWQIPSEKEINSSRYAGKSLSSMADLKELIKDVQVILNRVAEKSERLIGNFTTNLAESWMAVRCKFDGGKVINRCSKGSWNTRCYGGALRKNLGIAWSPLTFQTTTKTQAGVFFHQAAKRQSQKLIASQKYKAKPESKRKLQKRKLESLKQSSSKKARYHYGSNLDDGPDVSEERLKQLCNDFVDKNLKKTEKEITEIERQTVDQYENELWKKERQTRLTSSNFGKVMARRSTNISTSLVKRIMYSKFKGNIHTIRGLTQEKNTVIEYENMHSNVVVKKAGFHICRTHPFLGASTDGIVQLLNKNEEGLIEIKNFLQTNSYMIKDAVKKIKKFCLEERKNQLKLKKNHEIYYQIQGQLNIFEKEWCDFILRRTNPYDIHIERIYRDRKAWEYHMLPKLEQFYYKFLLPEIALPRYGTYSGIRQPASPWFDPTVKTQIALYHQPPTSPLPGPSNVTNPHTTQSSQSEPKPGPSNITSSDRPSCSAAVESELSKQEKKPSGRPSRKKTVKFVGRHILHKWLLDEKKKKTKWYSGIVLDIIKGVDGDPNAEYKIQYDDEDAAYDVDDLYKDYDKGWVKFLDV